MSVAAGGITTVIEHPLTYPPVTTAELYREKREMARQKVVVDFGLWGALTPPSLPEIRDQWREGAIGFKAFMPFSEPAYPHVMDAEFLAGMREVEAVRGLVLVHAENDSLLRAGLARMLAEGRRDPMAHHESRPPSSKRRRCTAPSFSLPRREFAFRSSTSRARSAPRSCGAQRRTASPPPWRSAPITCCLIWTI
jgi:dihydroorotase-like cyclic amidohydrolase